MEKRLVKTLIRWDHKLGDNTYVKGKISGIGYVLLQDAKGAQFVNERTEKGNILTHKCTVDQYDNFINVVEELYPGLCIFDYNEETE